MVTAMSNSIEVINLEDSTKFDSYQKIYKSITPVNEEKNLTMWKNF